MGGGSFGNLSTFDSDETPLTVDGVSAPRDIVQFVRFEDYRMPDRKVDMFRLAQDLLHEVPKQVQTYCGLANIAASSP